MTASSTAPLVLRLEQVKVMLAGFRRLAPAVVHLYIH
jgi:hypothetical protein